MAKRYMHSFPAKHLIYKVLQIVQNVKYLSH